MGPRKGNVIDDYHGQSVADPYRWMEDPNDKELVEWIAKQNRITEAYVRKYPGYPQINKSLKELFDYPKYELGQKVGDYYYYKLNDGLQNQPVLYRQKGHEGQPEVVLDPNKLSADGTVALYVYSFNKAGNLMGYSLSASGSDRQEIRIRDLETDQDFPEVLYWARFTNIAWVSPDRFLYSRYPKEGSVPPEDESNFCQVYCHKVGTPQSEDELIYHRPDAKELSFWPIVSEDKKYVILHVSHGTDSRNRVYYRLNDGEGEFIRLLDEGDATYDFVGNDGDVVYFHTNYQADRGRIISLDLDNPQKDKWQEIIPEQPEVVAHQELVDNKLVIAYKKDAYYLIKVYTTSGEFMREIALPTLGSITGIFGKPDQAEMLLGFDSFLYPHTIFSYDFDQEQLVPLFSPKQTFDPKDYQTKQVFFSSKDGTKVPIFLVYKKGLQLTGDNPTLLYAYGGFNISITPHFAPTMVQWMKMGGIYAVANLRGGSEYGEAWHRAGMLENKQNVFDDFIAAAEFLIANNYTKPSKLAIMGRSNGGLLVSACMVQRPDLYGAVVCGVPVTDMLRFHKFTVGRYWVPEYGDPEKNPDHFRFISEYSPLHNIQEKAYPSIIITTADTDDRVVPAHSFKLAATLHEHQQGNNPILLRVEKKAGHGHGKPITKIIEEQTDVLSFLALALDIN